MKHFDFKRSNSLIKQQGKKYFGMSYLEQWGMCSVKDFLLFLYQNITIRLISSDLLHYYLKSFFAVRITQLLILIVATDFTAEKYSEFWKCSGYSKSSRIMVNLQFCCSLFISIVSLFRLMHHSMKASSASKIL